MRDNPANAKSLIELLSLPHKAKPIPNTNYNGTDSFDYTISDGNGGTDTKTVTITVNSVNDNPVAVIDSVITDEDTAVAIDVLTPAYDVDGDTITIDSFTQTTHGAVILNENNRFVYTPNANYHGDDSFVYTISDGNGGFATQTVTLTINSVNDNPVVTINSAITN